MPTSNPAAGPIAGSSASMRVSARVATWVGQPGELFGPAEASPSAAADRASGSTGNE